MTKFAVLSDIHSNLDAFEEVLRDIDTLAITTIYSLGDNIGYGPEPDAVIERLRSLDIPSVLGNHELAVNDPSELDWFNPVARESLRKTVAMLSAEALDQILQFPYCRVHDAYRFVLDFRPIHPSCTSSRRLRTNSGKPSKPSPNVFSLRATPTTPKSSNMSMVASSDMNFPKVSAH